MNKESLDIWYNLNIDIKDRTIYFGPWNNGADLSEERKDWEVDDWSAQNLIKGLYSLDKVKKANIDIIWFSYGGDWDAGMAIYDFIRHIKSPVTMQCFGRVRSMGTIILQACKRRYLSPHCEFLIHYGTATTDKIHSKDAIRLAKNIERDNATMEGIYLRRIKEKHPRFTRLALQEIMKYDKYMSPKEAINIGLADKIILK